MKERLPSFKKCMEMMRKRDGQTQEDGFHWLLPHAGEYVHELIEEFGKEDDFGLRCWLLELIGLAKSPNAFDFLASQLRADDWRLRKLAIEGLKCLDTKESRTLLWQARSFSFASPDETEAFRSPLESVLTRIALRTSLGYWAIASIWSCAGFSGEGLGVYKCLVIPSSARPRRHTSRQAPQSAIRGQATVSCVSP